MHIEWLKAAKDDLVLIEKIIDEPTLTHLTAFHSQQAVEKSLKALLEYKQYDVPKIHSITLHYLFLTKYAKFLK
jgi:HEPN domain-containing protein